MTTENNNENIEPVDDPVQENDTDESSPREGFELTPENFPEARATLLYFIQLMVNHSYIYLGLIPIPGTEHTLFRLDDAKQSIDLLETLINHAKPEMKEDQIREMDAVVSQLRMNFVMKSQKTGQTESPASNDENKGEESCGCGHESCEH